MGPKIARSRTGCKSCKRLKIKCDEQKPRCQNCLKRNIAHCDYTIVLQWGGRPYKNKAKKVGGISNTRVVDGVLRPAPPSITKITTDECLNDEIVTIDEAIATGNQHHPSEKPYCDVLALRSLVDSVFSDRSLISSSESANQLLKNDEPTSINTISLLGFHLPFPLPDILTSSPHYMELFDFYLRETCHYLIPVPREIYRKNPFYVVLPQMAMQSPTLLYLLLAFGANHKSMLVAQATHMDSVDLLSQSSPLSFSMCPSPFSLDCITKESMSLEDPFLLVNKVSVADGLLSKTFIELVKSLKNAKERTSDGTLASIMMLAAFDIFFSDKRRKWRAHMYGARKLMMERLENSKNQTIIISDVMDETNPRFFLTRWFTYVDIIGSLSSTNRVITTDKLSSLKYEFKMLDDKKHIDERRVNLNDIEYCTGMEAKVLSLLADTSWIIGEKERQQDANGNEEIPKDLLLQTLELDYEIAKYLRESEADRDRICELYYSSKESFQSPSSTSFFEEKCKGYAILRITNMIFGLTGSLQLKRRVLGMPLDSAIVKDLLLNITELLDHNIPLAAPSTSCVIFCLFCCGCELLDESMIKYRSIYMDRIDSLNQRGVSSAAMAKYIMEQCWSQKKVWWDILKEANLDITFAI